MENELKLGIILDILQKYEYYFKDTFTEYEQEGCNFIFAGMVFDIYKEDKPIIEDIIVRIK